MRKIAAAATALILVSVVAAHVGEIHSAEQQVEEKKSGEQQVEEKKESGVWTSLSGAYPAQTMPIVLIEFLLVSALTVAAVRHRLQLRSK